MKTGAIILLVASCSASPAAPSAPPPPPVASDAAASGDHAMTELLRDLVHFLSADVTADDIARRIGPIASDPGPPLLAELTPSLAGVRAAKLGRYPETGKPYVVQLELAAPIRVTALREAFGAYSQGRTDRGRPREIVFLPPKAGAWGIAVIAKLPAGASPIDEEMANTVVLRRDPPG